MAADRRLRYCVEQWPDCDTFLYDQRCCRFPKNCSPYPYPEQLAAGTVTDDDLEPPRGR